MKIQFSISNIHTLPFPPLFLSFFSFFFCLFTPAAQPRGQRGVFCRDCLHFPINWNPFQEKLIWLSQTSMHPAFTCAVPCLRSAGGIWPPRLAASINWNSVPALSPAVWSRAAPVLRRQPPAFAFVVFFCVLLSTPPPSPPVFFPNWWVFSPSYMRPGNHDTPSAPPCAHQGRWNTMGAAPRSLFSDCR